MRDNAYSRVLHRRHCPHRPHRPQLFLHKASKIRDMDAMDAMDATDANILARTGCFTLQWPRGTGVSILSFSARISGSK